MRKRLNLNDAAEIHNRLWVVDCHCDSILQMARGSRIFECPSDTGHVDLARLLEGGVRVQFFAAFIESVYKPFSSLTRAMQLIDAFYEGMETSKGQVVSGLSWKQINKDLRAERVVAILGIEGGEALNGDLSVLRVLYRLGVRFIGLTWNQRNQLADGAGESITGGGLTGFGREVVREMNRLGMVVDLAHISEAGFWDALEVSQDPVMVSHANCQSLCNHPRNLTDDQIKGLADKGGILGLSFVPNFLDKGGQTSLANFLDHVDQVAGLAGTGVLAIGSDFDGIDETPVGLEDCRCYPRVTAGLMGRGYTEKEIRGIMGENVINFLQKVLKP